MTARLESLTAYIEAGYNTWIQCECGRITYAGAVKLRDAVMAKCGSDRIEDAKTVLRCKKCGGRPVDIGPVKGWG